VLVAFSVENFRSILERQTLSLEATADDHLEAGRVIRSGAMRVLRSALVYGPNASGKSNLFDALRVMQRFILSSSREGQVSERIPVEPFRLLDGALDADTSFECEFFIESNRYRYGFAANRKRISAEWLFYKRPNVKEAVLFEREVQRITPNSERFSEGVERKGFARENALFLSVCAQLNGPVSVKILSWFSELRFVTGVSDHSYYDFTARRLRNPDELEKMTAFAQRADLSICGLNSELQDDEDEGRQKGSAAVKVPRSSRRFGARITTEHARYDKDGRMTGKELFDLNTNESEGTRKFIALSGPLFFTIAKGSILVIDEFEARLHPLLTQQIFAWFHVAGLKSNAQLLAATHDPLLMDPDLVRRDQIWFCEKDPKGATSLYSLAEFDSQRVRPSTNFARQYLLGIFGAVPHPAFTRAEIPGE
jgi:uncharacterized protein